MTIFKISSLFLLSTLTFCVHAASYSISTITIGYGKFDINAGNGNMSVNIDSSGKMQSVSIDVMAGFFGLKHRIQYSESIASLRSGKSIDFYMEGGSKPVLKLKSSGHFDASNGGKLSFSVLKADGYETTSMSILREAISKRFYLWDSSDRIIGDIGLNMRGYSLASMYIGWYELNLK